MAVCNHCGAQVAEGKPFCGSCGARMEPSAASASFSQAQGQYAPPPYRPAEPFRPAESGMRPPRGSRYAVMGVGGFVGTLFLMMVPIVNFVVLIVWACGGARNQNKRNFARAMLIVTAILFVLSFALFFWLGYTGLLTPETIYENFTVFS